MYMQLFYEVGEDNMSEEEKRQHRCCFTGHRPEKLNVSESFVKESLEKEIHRAITDGMNVFITGMARGTDIWAALIVLKLREVNPDIKLMCACPHPDFEKRWSADWQEKYNYIWKETMAKQQQGSTDQLSSDDKLFLFLQSPELRQLFIESKDLINEKR